MAFLEKAKSFMNRTFYENPDEEAETTTATEEEAKAYADEVAAVADSEMEEDLSKTAEKIIADFLASLNGDEKSDISKVQFVLDTTGTDVDHKMFQKILINLVGCQPEDLEKDGVSRQEAIRKMLEKKRVLADQYKAESTATEQSLLQDERDAEAACNKAISDANAESERLIEEEKKRSAEAIAEIRKQADVATEEAKSQRDATLTEVARKRSFNDESLKRSVALMSEIERQSQAEIDKIEAWLSFLK